MVNKTYRVAYEIPSSAGFELTNIKIYTSLPKAKAEFNKRLRSFKKDVKNNDVEEGEGLILEDLNEGFRIESRIFDGEELQDSGGMR